MKNKLIKAMLNICSWVADDIGKEVDSVFINDIEAELIAVDEEIQEDDVIMKIVKNDFLEGWYTIEIEIDFQNSPRLDIHISDMDETGFKITGISFNA